MKSYRYLMILTVFVSSLLLSACQVAAPGYYRGASAADMTPVMLADALEGEQLWSDLYLAVSYRLEPSADHLRITGALTFTDGARINYSRVGDLKLKLFLLDRDLKVVSHRDIARTLSYDLTDTTTFDQLLPLDAGVVALAIGYDGYLIGDDFDAPGGNPIWSVPKRVK